MKIILVGAGGTGMSGIAGILYTLGYTKNIVCIDGNQSQLTDNLKNMGLEVIIGHDIHQVEAYDAVIYSEAAANSPEVTKARELSKTTKRPMLIMNYFQFLGEISKYFTTIGITGTNGKSSSTALTIYGAKKCLPEFALGILGALTPDFNEQSFLINSNHTPQIKEIFDYIFTGKIQPKNIKDLYFIVEACEYKRHFLYLDLDYTAITSMEFDHADYYKDFDDYQNAYHQMLGKLRYKAFALQGFTQQFPSFQPYQDKIQETPYNHYDFKYIFGPHVDKNASLTMKILETISQKTLPNELLKDFKGLWRRLEYLGENNNGAKIFTDYGHMASSIAIGHDAIKNKFPDKKITAIFQPHQIRRIHTGRNDFQNALLPYDQKYIYDIYAARENLEDFDFSAFTKEIHNIEELGHAFAKSCGANYLTNQKEFFTTIDQQTKDTIIILYTAGDGDYQLRKEYPIQKTIGF